MLAHVALQKLNILPSRLLRKRIDPLRERAFIYASIIIRCQDEKKNADKLK